MGILVEIDKVALLFHCFQIELEFKNIGFCGGRKTGEPREKPSSKDEKQQQTHPTYCMTPGSEIQTRDALVAGEHSHHCAIPLPIDKLEILIISFISSMQVINTVERVILLYLLCN